MSVTTSTNTVTQSFLHTLTDYDVHHSGNPENPETPSAPNTRNDTAVRRNQPENWPSNYQRIPTYRPIDYTLNEDPDERPAGSNFIEALFIFTMLNGCRINSVSSVATLLGAFTD
jgi:hypothetical protein